MLFLVTSTYTTTILSPETSNISPQTSAIVNRVSKSAAGERRLESPELWVEQTHCNLSLHRRQLVLFRHYLKRLEISLVGGLHIDSAFSAHQA